MFEPGRPLPCDPQTTQERTLYHHVRGSGAMATMTHEGGTWQFCQLHGQPDDASTSGGWNDLQNWLKKSSTWRVRSWGTLDVDAPSTFPMTLKTR